MLITVERDVSDHDTTLSNVYVDGRWVCHGCEDEFREEKVARETRIPAGRYRVGLRREGGFHARYSRRFRDIHRGMLHILDVPNFRWILIHVGNTDDDTAGCLLVGMVRDATPGDMRVFSSVKAYRILYPMVIDAAERGELEIDFIDRDHRVRLAA